MTTINQLGTIADLRRDYLDRVTAPVDVVREIFQRVRSTGMRPVWISLADEEAALARARSVDLSLPLGGVPFAVKDNIDVAGMPTTAACPAFAYVPDATAPAVQRLLDAGAILIGKTNLDQFATGLVGARSPYGTCVNAFDERYISGGSSSGSAIATTTGLCAFALGTDTAGSGRVPAAFNNLVGFKPTLGRISTTGVVPACRSIDCVSIFATTAADAATVWRIAQGYDADNPYSRVGAPGAGAAPWLPGPFRFGVPDPAQLEFFGDDEAAVLFAAAIPRFEAIGGLRTTIDFTPFRETSALLYQGARVAERLVAFGDFVSSHPEEVHPVIRHIVGAAGRYSGADAYDTEHRLKILARRAAREWEGMDVLLLPTTGTIYTTAQIEVDPIRLNINLGLYTQFANLLDLAAVALPAGARRNGVPFGVSVIGPAFSDEALLALAGRVTPAPGPPSSPRLRTMHGGLGLGAAGETAEAPGCVLVAVAGAHLRGQPLNWQLTVRGARFVRVDRTAPQYRMFALNHLTPPKPGIVHDPSFAGGGLQVEIWAIPESHFGGFVAEIPPPLGIGTLAMADGSQVKGFVCESAAAAIGIDITHYGGWLEYRHASAPAV